MFIWIYCLLFYLPTTHQNNAIIRTYILPEELPLISGEFYDFSLFDNSANIIPISTSLQNVPILPDRLMMGFYNKYYTNLTAYKFDPPDFSQRKLLIYLNPCTSLAYQSVCEQEIQNNGAQDNTLINPGKDILVYIETDEYLLECKNNYITMNLCGTFLEIHRPFDEKVLVDRRINAAVQQPTIYRYIPTKGLCTGKYEVLLLFYCFYNFRSG